MTQAIASLMSVIQQYLFQIHESQTYWYTFVNTISKWTEFYSSLGTSADPLGLFIAGLPTMVLPAIALLMYLTTFSLFFTLFVVVPFRFIRKWVRRIG